MLTQTHALIAVALFAGNGPHARVASALAGALLPDADLWAMILTEAALGSSGCEIFHYRFFEPRWQALQSVMNSAPVWLAVLAAGWHFERPLLRIAAAAALLHLGADFLLHHDDARAHFWPLSDWRFRSPVSYWDPAHYGRLAAAAELLLGLALLLWLLRRARTRGAVALLAAAFLAYAVPLGVTFGQDAQAHARGPGSCDARPNPRERWHTGSLDMRGFLPANADFGATI